jgi:hypothetical protein
MLARVCVLRAAPLVAVIIVYLTAVAPLLLMPGNSTRGRPAPPYGATGIPGGYRKGRYPEVKPRSGAAAIAQIQAPSDVMSGLTHKDRSPRNSSLSFRIGFVRKTNTTDTP